LCSCRSAACLGRFRDVILRVTDAPGPRGAPVESVHPFQRRPIRVRPHEMTVGVERELGSRVTQPSRHGLDVDAGRIHRLAAVCRRSCGRRPRLVWGQRTIRRHD